MKQDETAASAVKETRLYSLSEAGELLGISHQMMLYYVTRGKIKGIKIGSRWKVRGTDLMALVYN